MATCEKRRPSPPAAAAGGSEHGRPAPSTNGLPDSEDAFLLQAGVSDIMREALLKVLEARPEEPVDFLAGYFEKLMLCSAEGPPAVAPAPAADGGDLQWHWQLQQRLDRALWYSRQAHHSHR